MKPTASMNSIKLIVSVRTVTICYCCKRLDIQAYTNEAFTTLLQVKKSKGALQAYSSLKISDLFYLMQNIKT